MEEAKYAISMHQPWASLLVHGIKRIEGRSWSTKYRGRLWIHATAHEPSKQIVEEVEQSFCDIWAIENAHPCYPQRYPTSCILGCVKVHDCLRIESVEAWTDLPASVRAEVGSPYCFLCENPWLLVMPHKMSGSLKIWPLCSELANDLVPGLKPADQVGGEAWSWHKFPVPTHIRNVRLPRSANYNKWNRQYCLPSQASAASRQEEDSWLNRLAKPGSWREFHKVSQERLPLASSEDSLASPEDNSNNASRVVPPPPLAPKKVAPIPVLVPMAAWCSAKASPMTAAEHLRRIHNIS